MSLSDLTSKEAVLKALSEFDAIGREAFLAKYGFGKALSYFLVHEGRRYDSKAIAGAAHGYQFPERGPLTPADFSGGDQQLRPRLEKLGFTIEVTPAEDAPTAAGAGKRHWVFQANPERYDLLRSVSENDTETWTARQSARDLQIGDDVLLWMAGPHAGGYALGHLTSLASERPPRADLRKYWRPPLLEGAPDEIGPRVDLAIDKLLVLRPITRTRCLQHPVLSQLNVVRQPAGTVFRVTDEQWAELTAIANAPTDWSYEELVLALALHLDVKAGQIPDKTGAMRRMSRLFGRADGAVQARIGTYLAFESPGTGFENGSAGAKAVFDKFAGKPAELRKEAAEISERLLTGGGVAIAEKSGASSNRGIWKIAPGREAKFWEECRREGAIVVGWDELGDLSRFVGGDRAEFEKAYQKANPGDSEQKVSIQTGMLWSFLNEVKDGDVIVANRGKSVVVGRGEVVGGYEYRPQRAEYRHARRVRWFDTEERNVGDQGSGWMRTVWAISDENYAALFASSPAAPSSPTKPSIYDFLQSRGLHFPDELVTSYLLALKTKPFVILSGISGTGKTKLAQLVAEWAGSEVERREREVPTAAPNEAEGEWLYELQPYNFKHRKIVISKAARMAFFEHPGEGTIAIPVRFEEIHAEGSLRVSHPDGKKIYELRLPIPVLEQLEKTSGPGDAIRVSVEEDDAGKQFVELARVTKTIQVEERRIDRHSFISVRPDWMDGKGILGFFNVLSERYSPTPFLRRMLEAFADSEKPHFVILDEMNLARVEHYFSDLLSATESRRPGADGAVVADPVHLHDDPQCLPLDDMESPRPAICTGCKVSEGEMAKCRLRPDGIQMVPPRMPVPPNVFVTGTVNIDETTHMFSPKVLDRANVLEFNEVRLGGYGPVAETAFRLKEVALQAPLPATTQDYQQLPAPVRTRIEALNAALHPFNLHFGYRVANEMARFILNAIDGAGDAFADTAVDLQVLQKVLPKLHGTKQRLEEPVSRLLALAVWGEARPAPPTPQLQKEARAELSTARWPRSAAKLDRMLGRLRDTGFASFIE